MRHGIEYGIVSGENSGSVNPLAGLIDSHNCLEVLEDVTDAVDNAHVDDLVILDGLNPDILQLFFGHFRVMFEIKVGNGFTFI